MRLRVDWAIVAADPVLSRRGPSPDPTTSRPGAAAERPVALSSTGEVPPVRILVAPPPAVTVERWERFTGGIARLEGEETSFSERRAA